MREANPNKMVGKKSSAPKSTAREQHSIRSEQIDWTKKKKKKTKKVH